MENEKQAMINEICKINKKAKASFLNSFLEEEIKKYLDHLKAIDLVTRSKK